MKNRLLLDIHIPQNNPLFEEKLVEKRASLEEQADCDSVHASLPCRDRGGREDSIYSQIYQPHLETLRHQHMAPHEPK